MLFNSVTFLAFFSCVLALHYLPLPWSVRKCNLLIASYLFYAAWTLWFPLLLVYATLSNWLAAFLIARWDGAPGRRRIVLWINVVLNIGLLCIFKYGVDIIEVWQRATNRDAAVSGPSTIEILLPVGLSFFTFQALSYAIDVYRRTIAPTRSVLDFALFVAFFPVLLAGPLLRAGQFLPQCAKPQRASANQLGFAAALITHGLFLKVALADQILSPVVRQVFAPHVQPDALSAWIGTVAFAGQDYCDFAGYSTCAMGIGLCLGFTLPENFRSPFASVGFRDLWQRWHITLVAWMRDYVFNSLGGVYKGYLRAAINVMVVMVLIGLWHGAAWSYVIFGVLHGTYLIGETLLQRSPIRRQAIWNGFAGTFILWLATMLLCLLAFVFYRSVSMDQSKDILFAMCGAETGASVLRLSSYETVVTAIVIEALVAAHWLCRNVPLAEVVVRVPWWGTATCLALMLLAIALSSGESQDFLYFNY